ncbi:MAG: hypothetical protein A2854_04405 [Parcubacteria group bacterium RIFCSPHIGHO2_01_FULL_56_18]|nr:MAG: hypothetical protein A2854_04405 [Parcubacteria group bacterium RIFCSPHIGHO2_01_FULL_56_18]
MSEKYIPIQSIAELKEQAKGMLLPIVLAHSESLAVLGRIESSADLATRENEIADLIRRHRKIQVRSAHQ